MRRGELLECTHGMVNFLLITIKIVQECKMKNYLEKRVERRL